MRFRQHRERPHEETPVHRGPVSVGSLLIAVTLKPFEELPPGVTLETVLADLGGAVGGTVADWYEKGGDKFCVAVPDVA